MKSKSDTVAGICAGGGYFGIIAVPGTPARAQSEIERARRFWRKKIFSELVSGLDKMPDSPNQPT